MKQKKSIRFSTIDLGSGGAEKILISILKSLSRDKYNISIILFDKTGVYLKDIPSDVQLNYFISPEKWPKILMPFYRKVFRRIAFRLFMYIPSLVYILSKSEVVDIDVAFLQDTSYFLKSNYAKTKLAWVHTDAGVSLKYRNWLSPMKYAQKIIGVSSGVTKSIATIYPNFTNKTITIYNPTPIDEVQQAAKAETIIFSKPTIIAVGKFKEQKGFDILIKSFRLLIDKGYDWNLKILGDGDDEIKIKNLISQLDLSNQVELLGFKKNPYPYMHSADIFVLSSRCEGFAQVIVEALAVGVPVVATDCDFGPREILKNGEIGILVPVDDIKALTLGIERVINDSNLKHELINKGLIRARDFDLYKTVLEIEKVLDEL